MTQLNSKIILAAGAAIAMAVLIVNTRTSPVKAADDPSVLGACYIPDGTCKQTTSAGCDTRDDKVKELKRDYWAAAGTVCNADLQLVNAGVSLSPCLKEKKMAEAEKVCLGVKLDREIKETCGAGEVFKEQIFGVKETSGRRVIDKKYDVDDDECHVSCGVVGKCVPDLAVSPTPTISPSLIVSVSPSPTALNKTY